MKDNRVTRDAILLLNVLRDEYDASMEVPNEVTVLLPNYEAAMDVIKWYGDIPWEFENAPTKGYIVATTRF